MLEEVSEFSLIVGRSLQRHNDSLLMVEMGMVVYLLFIIFQQLVRS